ncbi:MAG: hypothetical protein UGF89_11005 [Acutalibacteraceae bacterium]|nr:hypothetical protein [Acutalibacteraceae bacterium]
MEKYITIKQSDFEAILGYVDTVLEFAYPEGKNIAKVNNGYETFIKPFRETNKLQTPEVYARNQEIETFAENLQELYGVDTAAVSKTLLEKLYDKFNEEFSGETGEIESNIITRLVNVTPLPALVAEEVADGDFVTPNNDLFVEAKNFVISVLGYSDKKTKIFGSVSEEEAVKNKIATMILDFATQELEKTAKSFGLAFTPFDVEHKGLKHPEYVTVQKADPGTSKKGNMAYWDVIENRSEEFLKVLIEYLCEIEYTGSVGSLEEAKDDAVTEANMPVVEFTTELLIKEFDAFYPYVDEDY